MKSCSLFMLLALLLLSCLDREVIKIANADAPLTNTWCNNSRMSYQFEPDGRFFMRDASGNIWGGYWRHTPDLPGIDIILHHGPDRRIQHISLRELRYDHTQLTATWTDEISRTLPVIWKPCTTVPGLK